MTRVGIGMTRTTRREGTRVVLSACRVSETRQSVDLAAFLPAPTQRRHSATQRRPAVVRSTAPAPAVVRSTAPAAQRRQHSAGRPSPQRHCPSGTATAPTQRRPADVDILGSHGRQACRRPIICTKIGGSYAPFANNSDYRLTAGRIGVYSPLQHNETAGRPQTKGESNDQPIDHRKP
jgi:hypothetical protein